MNFSQNLIQIENMLHNFKTNNRIKLTVQKWQPLTIVVKIDFAIDVTVTRNLDIHTSVSCRGFKNTLIRLRPTTKIKYSSDDSIRQL